MVQPRSMGGMKSYKWAVVIDVICVIIFAIAGVLSHDEALTGGTLLRVGAPFLVGLLLGHAIMRTWRVEPTRIWPHALMVVAVEIATAMVIRSAIGDGTAIAFVIVSILVNLLLLVGWRLVARMMLGGKRTVVADASRP